ncbi:FtsK/SpoIIIE domain-containing protein [Brevibacillus centrosporus]|uniref:FtsK/SpoIIIE domain-containing protein n=1 Tax=Brevibacillus centrosporus TaxID=54910 RepID=UPI002E2226B9|nr:FtsK/SpoIIIE domain-containing protein [Brevibacillus centrosporus]MED1949008.1 FtsK/SpoIIIE domain-containing protein [Brevibacillus centrosporus]
MFIEIFSSAVMGSIVIFAQFKKSGSTNDSDKLNKIFSLTGLNVRDKEKTYTTQLLKKKNYDWGAEYCYRIPLGRSFEDYQAKFNHIQDGLNNRKTTFQFTLAELKALDFRQSLVPQIKELLTKKKTNRKEIELSYDGLLKVKVYNTPMPTKVNFTDIAFNWDGWKVPVGQIREGNTLILHDFEKVPHLVVGGATRYGKSNFLNMLISTLIILQPDNVQFTLIDLKGGVEFHDFLNAKQVIHYAEEPEEAEEALAAVVGEMREKQQEFKRRGVKNVQEAKDPVRHFVIIDEVGELNPAEAVTKAEKELKERCQTYMSQIARLGAGLGYRQILATQYPTGDVIPRQCKQNSDAKLCFRVQNGTASRVVLDETGAETLPEIKGRAIYQTADKRQIVQTPIIETKTIRQAVSPHIVFKPRKEKADESPDQHQRETRANPSQPGKIQFHE